MRKGKKFKTGYPYVSDRGIAYDWPGSGINGDLFLERKKELSPILLEKTRQYLAEFEVFTNLKYYPYLQDGPKGIAIHIGDGGRWFEVENFAAGGAIGVHNLDGFSENFVAFNVGSEAVELLDSEFKAPRILVKNRTYTLEYPLPEGHSVLPLDRYPHLFKKTFLNRFFEFEDSEKDISDIINEKNVQEIRTSIENVVIKEGMCRAIDFAGWDAKKVSFAISVLFRAFNEK